MLYVQYKLSSNSWLLLLCVQTSIKKFKLSIGFAKTSWRFRQCSFVSFGLEIFSLKDYKFKRFKLFYNDYTKRVTIKIQYIFCETMLNKKQFTENQAITFFSFSTTYSIMYWKCIFIKIFRQSCIHIYVCTGRQKKTKC